ncbi:MAG: hypothetical protein HW402_1535 [Dehalococcoidales bacterium]|nr:hypothetical protein [Dehalococcoidales bacterium]
MNNLIFARSMSTNPPNHLVNFMDVTSFLLLHHLFISQAYTGYHDPIFCTNGTVCESNP